MSPSFFTYLQGVHSSVGAEILIPKGIDDAHNHRFLHLSLHLVGSAQTDAVGPSTSKMRFLCTTAGLSVSKLMNAARLRSSSAIADEFESRCPIDHLALLSAYPTTGTLAEGRDLRLWFGAHHRNKTSRSIVPSFGALSANSGCTYYSFQHYCSEHIGDTP